MVESGAGLSASVWARLVLLSFLWGSEFLLVKIALRGSGPVELVFLRLGLAAMFLMAIAKLRGERIVRDALLYFHCAVLGLLGTALPYFLMSWAEQRVSSALTGVLVGSGPLLTAALSAAFLPGERLGLQRVGGLAIGLVGVALVIDPWHADFHGTVLGSLAAIGVAFGFALGFVYNTRFVTSHSASGSQIMAIQIFFGAVWCGLWLLGRGTFWFGFGGGPGVLVSIVVLGIVNTGAAAIVFFSLLRSAGPVATSVVEYLMLIVAVVLGVVFLGESVSLVTVIGVVLIIAGVAITETARSRDRAKVCGG